MMAKLFLADLKDMTEEEIKTHIAENYAGKISGFDYGNPSDEEKRELKAELENFDLLVAYESVGNWGCDSSSFFLFKHKETGVLYENHGSHCSCYGFEGQWEPEETSVEYLLSDKFGFCTGGYDDEGEAHIAQVSAYVESVRE